MLSKILIALTFSLVSTFALAANDLPTPHKTLQPLDTIVATVNNDVITQNEFNTALTMAKKQFQEQNLPLPSEKALRKKVLENLINRQLQLQLAKQHDIKASKKEVQTRLQLIAQRNHTTLSQLKAQAIATGLSFNALKKQIHDQLVMEKVQQQMIQGSISVTPKEIHAFRETHSQDLKTMLFHVGDILIPVSNMKKASDKSKAHDTALAIMRAIRQGSSVADAIKKYHAKYTDLGKRRLSDLPALFAKPLVSIKTKGIAGPIEAPNGYHVLYLIAKQSGISQLSDKQIQNLLMQQKYEKGINDSLEKIRENAYIKINPEYE